MEKLKFNEPRVYRKIGFPVTAFDALQTIKRAWGLETNGEVLTRLLLEGERNMMKNDEHRTPDKTEGS